MSTTQDHYPSRHSDQPNVSERQDPVIYTPTSGPLTPDQLSFYEKNGYLFLESFYDHEALLQFQSAQQRLRDTYKEKPSSEAIYELGTADREVRSIFNIHQTDRFFKDVSRNPKLKDISTQILGSDVYIHQSRINYKPAFRGKEFYWHSDFETWHVEDGMPRMRALSCSILLNENTAFNGSLMVIPGSHQWFVSCVGKTPQNHFKSSLRKQEYGVPDDDSISTLVAQGGIACPQGPAGSVLIFDCNLIHGSNSNISPYPRTNYFVVYNSIHNKLERPFGQTTPRPDYIANRVARAL
jgi:ectoine hydroxylase